jgi:magnesium transporter
MGGMGTARNHFDFHSMDEYGEKEKKSLRESYGASHHHHHHQQQYDRRTPQWDAFEDDGGQGGERAGTSSAGEGSRLIISRPSDEHDRRQEHDDSVPEADLIGSANGSLASNGRRIGGTTVGDADSIRNINMSSSSPRQDGISTGDAEDGAETVGGEQSTTATGTTPGPFVRRRQRKTSQSNPVHPGARRQGRLALFEGLGGALLGDGMGNGRDGSFSVNMAPPEDDQGLPRGLTSALPTKAARSTQKIPNILGGGGGGSNGGLPVYQARSTGYMDYPEGGPRGGVGEERPYRFSFYSNALPATIHARSLSELPSEGQTFEDLFAGRTGASSQDEKHPGEYRHSGSSENGYKSGSSSLQTSNLGELSGGGGGPNPKLSLLAKATAKAGGMGGSGGGGSPPMKGLQHELDDSEAKTWWLDVLSPTDEEMRMLAKVGGAYRV